MMTMEGKRSEEIRKGPWKAEEDEVLINHVKKYGPRDWSSIRSKGFLNRTGKSCRLRWVNKLRPNLKNGCKFSLEEEKIVLELQAEFGNKWARIATFLPGRTDNDVKNFWSSRQKRMARILQNSTTPSSSSNLKSCRIANRDAAILEAPKFSSTMEEDSSSKPQSCSSSTIVDNSETIKMVSLPDLVNPKLLRFDPPTNSYYDTPSTESLLQIPFPQIPPQDLTFSPDRQELLSRLGDPYFFDFGPCNPPPLQINERQLPLEEPPMPGCSNAAKEADSEEIVNPDIFFDDFPTDMFDPIEPFPSPPKW